MKERILQFIQSEQISSTQFADAIGVQRSSVSHILSGRNNPSFDFIQKILIAYPQVSAEWLILGNGAMYKQEWSRELFDENPSVYGDVTRNEQGKLERNEKTGGEEDNAIKIEPSDIERIVIFYKNNTFTEYRSQ